MDFSSLTGTLPKAGEMGLVYIRAKWEITVDDGRTTYRSIKALILHSLSYVRERHIPPQPTPPGSSERGFVVCKGSKIRSIFFNPMPDPVSSIAIRTPPHHFI
jgi:hypothetical protein